MNRIIVNTPATDIQGQQEEIIAAAYPLTQEAGSTSVLVEVEYAGDPGTWAETGDAVEVSFDGAVPTIRTLTSEEWQDAQTAQ